MKKSRFTEDGMDASLSEGEFERHITTWGVLLWIWSLVSISQSEYFNCTASTLRAGEISRVKLQRPELLDHFAKLSPAIVAMEACSSSHHWARRFSAMGHTVRLIAPKFVRPFVKTNKTDAADAQAI